MKEVLNNLIAGIILILVCPFGWIGLLCLAAFISAIRGN